MTSFSSNELNYLIWKYLVESGLTHTAFLFRQESNLSEAEIDSAGVAVGSLTTIVQKGLYYVEAELCGSVGDGNGVLLEGLSLIEAVNEKAPLHKVSPQLRQQQQQQPQQQQPQPGGSSSSAANNNNSTTGTAPSEMSSPGNNAQRDRDREARQNQNGATRNRQISPRNNGIMGPHAKKQNAAQQASLNSADVDSGEKDELSSYSFPKDKIRFLKCHMSEVFICAWNPHSDLMASGSGDSTTRIWDLTDSENKAIADYKFESGTKILRHGESASNGQEDTYKKEANRNQDVTSLDWNSAGTMLATGCYDGYARIWNSNGTEHKTLGAHKGPIFALKWNNTGDYILSAGVDKTTIVWDAHKGELIQQFRFHTASALDVDWITADTFASCSTDKTIQICKLGQEKSPLRTFKGHENEVNAVKYDPHSQSLASCSDDMTLRIWSLNQDDPVHIWRAHQKEIYTIRWSPTGNMLASASFDHTVRLWDVRQGEAVRTLTRHTDPVYSVSFSPDGRFLASGCFDRSVFIWDVHNGKLLQSYNGDKNQGGIFEVSWNCRGDKVAASASDGTVILLDVRHIKNRLI